MATTTTTQPKFAEASAREMPTLACIGRVTKVEGPKETQKNKDNINYLSYLIQLEGYGASKNIRVNLMVRPEWFSADFNPAVFKEIEGGKGLNFMYSKHIAQRGSVSTLQGLVAARNQEDEVFGEFVGRLFGTAGDPVKLQEVLEAFLIDEKHGQNLGYILKQQQEKSGEDEDGKATYVDTQYYEVGGYFTPDEKGRKRQYDRADKNTDGSFRVSFTDQDVPF